jgi:hypothetical protein
LAIAPKQVGNSDVVASNDIVCEECAASVVPARPQFEPDTDLLTYSLCPSKSAGGMETLYIRLYSDGGTCLMIERSFVATDKSRTTQILPIKTLPMLRDFIANDEFYTRFRAEFERVYEKAASHYVEQDLASLEQLSFEGDPIKALKTLRNIRSESTLMAAVDKWIRIFGAEYFTYARIVRNHPNPQVENRLWLVGFSPAYSQIYNARRWYENDPYVLRSRTSDETFCGHQTPTMTDGQARLREVGHQYGINALIVIPVHGHNKAHLGILYVCLDSERMSGERMLQEHEYHFQLLARELHNWWGERMRRDAINKYELDDLETGLLRLVKNDVALGSDQAEELDVPQTRIYKLNQSIKKKFDTTDLQVAARIASVYGLI